MPSVLLQFILLFAVATSQIFGGISCCCLGRVVSSQRVDDGSNAPSANAQESIVVAQQSRKQQTGTCAKCSLTRAGGSPGRQADLRNQDCRETRVSEDGRCRCVKIVTCGNVRNDPNSSSPDTQIAADQDSFAKSEHAIAVLLLRRFEIPIRFGGHSWQSVNCIWVN